MYLRIAKQAAMAGRYAHAKQFKRHRRQLRIPRSLGGHDTDRADPAPATRLAIDPAELHRQSAFFEGDAGMRRSAQHGSEYDAKNDANEQHPTSDFGPAGAIGCQIGDAGALRGFDAGAGRSRWQIATLFHEDDSVTSAWLSGGVSGVAAAYMQRRQLVPPGPRYGFRTEF